MNGRGRLRYAIGVCLASAMLVSACDETKAIHDRATALEAEGKRSEAADQFDLVCEKAPDSERCPSSRTHAAELRLEAAKSLIDQEKYEQAKALIDRVIASGVPEPTKSAKELVESIRFEQVIKWEKAQKLPNGREKFALIVDVERNSGRALGAKAQAWLDTEGLPFRLESVKQSCAKPASRPCVREARALIEVAPRSKEAAEAQPILDAYVKSEQARILPLFEQLELLVFDCAGTWKKDKAYQSWSPVWFEAMGGHRGKGAPPRPRWTSCKHDPSLATCDEVKRLEKRAASLRSQVGYTEAAQNYRRRMFEACYAGKYEKQTPQPPEEKDMRHYLGPG